MKTAKSVARRALGIVLSLVVIISMLMSFAACKKTGDVADSGTATVVVAVGDDVRSYTVKLDEIDGAVGAIALLDYLKGKGELDYTSVDSGYGPYLTAVGHLTEKPSEGIYVGIWTSVKSDQDRESIYATSVEYNGNTLYSTAVGMQELNVPEGAIIYFGELVYSY